MKEIFYTDITLPLIPEKLERIAINIAIEGMSKRDAILNALSIDYMDNSDIGNFYKQNKQIDQRAIYLKQQMAHDIANKIMFTKNDLVNVIVNRLKDNKTSSQHIAPLGTLLSKMLDWDSPQKIEITSEVTQLIDEVSDVMELPKQTKNDVICIK